MDIVKRIDDLKKIIESGKFDTKYAGFTKTEVLLNQHVLTVCESIYEYGKDIAAKITFAYSDPKTGLSKLSEMVIAKAGTPLNEIKEMGILSVMGIKINSNVTINEEKENVVAVESEKLEKTTEETEEETETEVVVESKEVEKTTEETTEVEVVEENTENTKNIEKTEETKAEEKVTETEENNNENIKDVTHSADDVEDVLTNNASEIFDKTPSPKDPLNEDFTENVPVGKVIENKVEENKKEEIEETEESNEIGEEFVKTVEKIIETREKTENENKETEEKVSPVKEENSSDKEDVPEYKKKELDSIQKGEIDVLVKHLTANKQDKKEVLEKFFKRLDYNKSLKKENSEEILEILVKESQRLANRYTEEILNLMFDEAYKGLIPETQGENLLMNIGSLKVLAVATAIAICEIVLYEMRYL